MSASDENGEVRLLVKSGCLVGESPIWDDVCEGLWWVDIRAPALHFLARGTTSPSTWKMPDTAGFVALCEDGRPLVGLSSGLKVFSPKTAELQHVLNPLEGRARMRLNEGRVDPKGRLWFGVMEDRGAAPIGALLRWTPGHPIEILRKGLNIPNGLSFGVIESDVTFTDSAVGTLLRLGANTDKDEVLLPECVDLGVPDGAVRDQENHVWLARFGGGCVIRVAPDGRIERRIRIPAPNVTAVALGGSDGRELYITTARLRLTKSELDRWPLSGSVFCARVPSPGRPEARLQLCPTE